MIYFYGEKFYIEYIIIAKNLPVSKKIRIFVVENKSVEYLLFDYIFQNRMFGKIIRIG